MTSSPRPLPGVEAMTQRTIKCAREYLELVGPRLNNLVLERVQTEITEAETIAKERAEAFIGERLAELNDQRLSVLQELCETRDAFTELATEGKRGRMSAEEYRRRLAELTKRKEQLEAANEQLASEADDVESTWDTYTHLFKEREDALTDALEAIYAERHSLPSGARVVPIR